jgi:hypothetical protein
VKQFFSRIDMALRKLLFRFSTKPDQGFSAGSSFGGDLQIKVIRRKKK